jgi:agmatine/peptidylarginine deiminase
MRWFSLLVLLLVLVTPVSVRADFVEEHPEYFGLTPPPPAQFVLASPHAHASRYAVRVGDLPIYGQMHLNLDGEKLLFVAAGADEMSQLEAYLAEYPLQAAAIGYVDITFLDSKLIGDFFPLLVSNGAVTRVVDPRYTVKNAHDDAAGSVLAEHWESCAYRPPVFLTRGHLLPLGDGRCILSKAVYARSPGLTEAEVNGQLDAFLGCKQMIALSALQKDGEGRLDTFVRLVTPETLLVGKYETIQDSANQFVMGQAVTTLTEQLGSDYAVETIAMPDPIVLGNETLRPSYLHYVQTKTRLIVPTFKSNESWQAKAYATLQKHLPKLTVTPLDATELTYGSNRLTSIVAPYPDLPLDTDCPVPELLCQSGSALNCALCYDECGKTGKQCVSGTDYGKCAKGDDDCYDLTVIACPDGSACTGNGTCDEGPGDCADIPAGGICDGDMIKKCVGETVISINCGADGQFCTINELDEAVCYLPCFDDCVPESTFCDGEAVYYCQPLPAGGEGCGQRIPQEVCPVGEVCQAGACVVPAPDRGPDVVSEISVAPGEDSQDWNAGFDEPDKGCRATPAGRPAGGLILLLALVALVLAPRFRRGTLH